jgi:hypothetical protein
MDDTTLTTSISPEEKQTAKEIIRELIPDIKADSTLTASSFIKKYWHHYQTKHSSNQNINGKVFEELIAITLIRNNILPFYMQAQVAFISYVNYDIIIYADDIGPISLSAKTSLRERWKQADLEAVALKYIHRKSESYVITLDTEAVRRRRVDPSAAMGIDAFVLADTEEYDKLTASLKDHPLRLSPTVQVVSSSVIITSENCIQRYT